jgi:putative aminopeptidase FrvX
MLLEELSNASGVAGNEGEVREKLIATVKDHVDEYRVDTIGNLITFKRGTGTEPRLKVMLAAHMDEIGLMIVAIEQNGHLRFRPVGGIDARVLLSKMVYVGKDKIPGVIGVKPIHLLKPKEREQVLEIDQLTIDIGAKNQEEAQGLVKLGDYASFATTFANLGGTVKGKALDDRAGCAVLAEVVLTRHHALLPEPAGVMARQQGGLYPYDLYAVFTVQEEVGLRGAMVAAYAVSPDLGFALEGTVCDDSPQKKDLSPTTRLGGGPAITIMDRSVIADKRLVKLLMDTAKELGIPYQIKQPGVGGTDAGRIHISKEGVPSAVVAVPCRYIHSPVSLLDLTDFQNTVKLMKGVLGRVTSWKAV